MKHTIYQVDAFTDKLFGGNPAAVCPLDKWLNDDILQMIAMENNLAETAFYIKKENDFQIRWFTPTVEVDLCGHATLATAFVIFNHQNYTKNEIVFWSPRSGKLTVRKEGEFLTLNFPTDIYEQINSFSNLKNGFDLVPNEVFKGKSDYMFIYDNEDQIKNIQPNIPEISKWQVRGVIVTAKGKTADFVSRFFGPQSGVDEDPVTGSAHTTLIPYWSDKLGKTELTALQLSNRGGKLKCKYIKERVEISGQAKLYLIGEIYVE